MLIFTQYFSFTATNQHHPYVYINRFALKPPPSKTNPTTTAVAFSQIFRAGRKPVFVSASSDETRKGEAITDAAATQSVMPQADGSDSRAPQARFVTAAAFVFRRAAAILSTLSTFQKYSASDSHFSQFKQYLQIFKNYPTKNEVFSGPVPTACPHSVTVSRWILG